ncbi:hypothetical protein [Clostridium felsineum]|uniref:hypothetical protein n=1 Tax=Clostridium felsineum TaxID=36839 RepID=UPI00098C5EF4|nr:hypothetical protein [Clostridium felsineum]URZ18520.1 hypothetical protein CLFE_046080 [Clostridium felsineum DSM 794]
MALTTNKLAYIKASSDSYSDLGQELQKMHETDDENTNGINDIKNTIASIKDEADKASNDSNKIATEVTTARGSYDNLNARLSDMSCYNILNDFEKISTKKTYEIDEAGNILKEHVRGQLNYDTIFTYDENKNIVKEELFDSNTKESIGSKTYSYDEGGNISKIDSENADIVTVLTDSLALKDISNRLSKIEAIDFIKTAEVLNSSVAATLVKNTAELLARVENLETYLPNSNSELIEIPDILNRLTKLETKLDTSSVLYTFTVKASVTTYDIPSNVTDKTPIYLEGVLLNCGEDYTIKNNQINFILPLIDDFEVTCKY